MGQTQIPPKKCIAIGSLMFPLKEIPVCLSQNGWLCWFKTAAMPKESSQIACLVFGIEIFAQSLGAAPRALLDFDLWFLGRPLGYLTFSLMALVRDPIY